MSIGILVDERCEEAAVMEAKREGGPLVFDKQGGNAGSSYRLVVESASKTAPCHQDLAK